MRRIKSLLFLMVAGVMASCGSQSEEQAAQAERDCTAQCGKQA